MAKPLAKITGVAIAPGVSRNNRLYTSQNIGRLVERANTRISGGASPITMRTHHGAGDDSTRIVGRVTRIWQDETGAARYEGEIADTGHGPTIAGLLPTSETDTSAALRGVSIRGRWAALPRKATTENGQAVETADDLEIDGIDFTANPGVTGAHAVVVSAADVPNVPPAPPNSGKSWETSVEFGIFEAAPDAEFVETADPAEPASAVAERTAPVAFADRGDYLPGGAKRFPLDTAPNAKRAWFALRETDVARQYTAAQLKRVRGRTTKALTEFGVYTDPNAGWLIEFPTRVVAEDMGDDSPGFGGAYRICLTNGPTQVSVSCYQLDPHDLDAVGRAAMTGAIAAIKAIDPDLDADIDIPDGGAEAAPAVETAAPEPPAPSSAPSLAPITPDPEPDEDDAVAEEPTNPTAGSPPADTVPAATAAPAEPDRIDKLTDMIGKLVAAIAPAPTAVAAEAALAAPVAEATAAPTAAQLAALAGLIQSPAGAAAVAQAAAAQTAAVQAQAAAAPAPVAETEDQRIARLVSEQVTARVQDLVESGQLGGARKGLTATAPAAAPGAALTENGLPEGWPNKPLHEYSEAEFSRYAFPQLENYVLNGRAPRA